MDTSVDDCVIQYIATVQALAYGVGSVLFRTFLWREGDGCSLMLVLCAVVRMAVRPCFCRCVRVCVCACVSLRLTLLVGTLHIVQMLNAHDHEISSVMCTGCQVLRRSVRVVFN